MNEWLIKHLLTLRRELDNYAANAAFDQRVFGRMLKRFDNDYKRADYYVQGEYHHYYCNEAEL